MLTGENHFNQNKASQQQLIWGKVSSHHHQERQGGPGVLVCRGDMLNRRFEFHAFDSSSLTRDCHCNKFILPFVLLFRDSITPDFIFVCDNARAHRSSAAKKILEIEDICGMCGFVSLLS
ncbi:transposable element Tcb2 transposase [Trichonephila clavipes]|nr:transposable element Tcb2 transposase [Trichonephila clavipes]